MEQRITTTATGSTNTERLEDHHQHQEYAQVPLQHSINGNIGMTNESEYQHTVNRAEGENNDDFCVDADAITLHDFYAKAPDGTTAAGMYNATQEQAIINTRYYNDDNESLHLPSSSVEQGGTTERRSRAKIIIMISKVKKTYRSVRKRGPLVTAVTFLTLLLVPIAVVGLIYGLVQKLILIPMSSGNSSSTPTSNSTSSSK